MLLMLVLKIEKSGVIKCEIISKPFFFVFEWCRNVLRDGPYETDIRTVSLHAAKVRIELHTLTKFLLTVMVASVETNYLDFTSK